MMVKVLNKYLKNHNRQKNIFVQHSKRVEAKQKPNEIILLMKYSFKKGQNGNPGSNYVAFFTTA
jgi:hypothetical protein